MSLGYEIADAMPTTLNFEGDPEAIKLVVDAHRLRNGHQFNKAFGLELSRVVPLPHQRVAVYEHMLPQNPLRFLLADDAGAGKTVMTGLYIREMLNRGRLRRVLICCPAGLTWNWQRELRNFFDLEFGILRGQDFQNGDPLSNDQGLFIISVDTAATEAIRERLQNLTDGRFDLVVFDEAHKLAWADGRRLDTKTRRYRLAETLAKSTHLLLLTATPHMGKQFPYFALWRLLDANVFSTMDALGQIGQEKRRKFFIRRLKEEMVDYQSQPIYKPRLCQTVKFDLSKPERDFYDQSSDYLRWSFENNRSLEPQCGGDGGGGAATPAGKLDLCDGAIPGTAAQTHPECGDRRESAKRRSGCWNSSTRPPPMILNQPRRVRKARSELRNKRWHWLNPRRRNSAEMNCAIWMKSSSKGRTSLARNARQIFEAARTGGRGGISARTAADFHGASRHARTFAASV